MDLGEVKIRHYFYRESSAMLTFLDAVGIDPGAMSTMAPDLSTRRLNLFITRLICSRMFGIAQNSIHLQKIDLLIVDPGVGEDCVCRDLRSHKDLHPESSGIDQPDQHVDEA